MEKKILKTTSVNSRAPRPGIVKPLQKKFMESDHQVLSDSTLELTENVENLLKKTAKRHN